MPRQIGLLVDGGESDGGEEREELFEAGFGVVVGAVRGECEEAEDGVCNRARRFVVLGGPHRQETNIARSRGSTTLSWMTGSVGCLALGRVHIDAERPLPFTVTVLIISSMSCVLVAEDYESEEDGALGTDAGADLGVVLVEGASVRRK